MKYAAARDGIKSGDVLGWTHRRLKSWYDFKVMLTRLFQLSEYCHVGVAVNLGGRLWVLEAVTPHVRFVPLSNLLPCYYVTGNGMTDEQLERGLALVGKEDVEYSQLECVKAFFGRNDLGNNQIECAELVSLVLDLTCRATPSDVIGHMLANGSMLQELQS